MENYNFKSLSEDLAVGREIEFEYNGTLYSIVNSVDGFWYLFCDTSTELMKICEFDDKETLIRKVSEYKINGTSIQEIFDSLKYDKETLWII